MTTIVVMVIASMRIVMVRPVRMISMTRIKRLIK